MEGKSTDPITGALDTDKKNPWSQELARREVLEYIRRERDNLPEVERQNTKVETESCICALNKRLVSVTLIWAYLVALANVTTVEKEVVILQSGKKLRAKKAQEVIDKYERNEIKVILVQQDHEGNTAGLTLEDGKAVIYEIGLEKYQQLPRFIQNFKDTIEKLKINLTTIEGFYPHSETLEPKRQQYFVIKGLEESIKRPFLKDNNVNYDKDKHLCILLNTVALVWGTSESKTQQQNISQEYKNLLEKIRVLTDIYQEMSINEKQKKDSKDKTTTDKERIKKKIKRAKKTANRKRQRKNMKIILRNIEMTTGIKQSKGQFSKNYCKTLEKKLMETKIVNN